MGTFYLDSASGVTYTAITGSGIGASAPEPSSVVLLGAALIVVCTLLRRRSIINPPVGKYS